MSENTTNFSRYGLMGESQMGETTFVEHLYENIKLAKDYYK